jgi:hypothetical protein
MKINVGTSTYDIWVKMMYNHNYFFKYLIAIMHLV